MAKKTKKWEPDDFELEMTTHWSFPNQGNWATHNAPNSVEIGLHIYLKILYLDTLKKEI